MKYFVVDAFTDQIFHGNPAGVCVIDHEIDPETMQSIAAENNLAETAFVTRRTDGFGLRWFTPRTEVDLCGHATLASAFILTTIIDPSADNVIFHTSSGVLTVEKHGDLLSMDFPRRPPVPIEMTALMEDALGAHVAEALLSRDLVLIVDNEEVVRDLHPDLGLINTIPDCLGVVVTARGNNVDFVSRFFAPQVGVPEDPVTGSSHSTLIPLWASRLNKKILVARQLSSRGGTLYCEDRGDRVDIAGRACLYLEGEILV